MVGVRRLGRPAAALLLALLVAAASAAAVGQLGRVELGYRLEPAELEALEDREYYYAVIEDLRRAEAEVLVAMYVMKYDPDDPQDWANDLVRALAEARERGVDVKVIIEYRTYRGTMDVNLEAYRYLRERGVDVRLDNDTETDHYKLVVIDGRIAYVGSHNWAEAGLYYNREVSVRVVDEGVARELREYFYGLWRSLGS